MGKNLSRRVGAGMAVTALLLSAACQGSSTDTARTSGSEQDGASGATSGKPSRPAVTVHANVDDGAQGVRVDTVVRVSAANGEIAGVRLSSPAGTVPGRTAADGASWRASSRLEPGETYALRVRGSDDRVTTTRFTTQALTLAQQTFASVAPLDGETVGVGMPVVVTFDVPVSDKRTFERHMKVDVQPAQEGAWHWLSDKEAHWRPASYWRAGSKVDVAIDVNSVPAGNGVYGQKDRHVRFSVGDAHVYKVDTRAHTMRVLSNGRLLRTLPITTGKDGFTTRSGVKVIVEKFASKRMNSETVGIGQGDPEFYDLDDVKWAMRLTFSGEFIHAAPWSVGQQGSANVSHGCTGMSTADAKWLYDLSRRGDVVEYTGTDRPMTLENGYGDWNVSFDRYRQGSALS